MIQYNPAPYTAKRIGSDRLATELSPIFAIATREDGTFGYSQVNPDFSKRHENDLDLFL